MSTKKLLLLVGVLLLLAAVLVACGSAEPVATDEPEAAVEEPVEEMVRPEPAIPFMAQWEESAHNASDTEPFRHWDGDDPAEVSTSCAKCHSTQGYVDFLGADGSEAGVVDAAVPAADVHGIECVACHNSVTISKTEVTFPSGVTVEAGDDSRCMECHQGRESMVSLNERLAVFGEDIDPDVVPAPVEVDGEEVTLGFANIHYYPAAATLYGGVAMGGYQFDGKTYDGKFRHVEGIDSCTGCHDPHTLEVKVETCAHCHEGVASVDDLKNVRMVSSVSDYDGDGDVAEGVYYEIEGLKEQLYAAMQAYAADTAGTALIYESHTYPYFFADTNGDGEAQEDEANYGNQYRAWTPNLLKAAYNYQMASKDPGNFAHGGKYTIQLLVDSIEAVGGDVSGLARSDAGHFAGDTEAFRHWDEDGEVSGSCAKCHSATGLPEFLTEGSNHANEISNGFMCSTCHNDAEWPARYEVASVTFPSGATVSFGGQDADGNFVADDGNMCLTCHQGRESKVSVDATIASGRISFRNIHYFAAGATLFGADVQGAYMYDGNEYAGYFEAHPLNKCQDCHDVHALEPNVETCEGCHVGQELEAIRMTAPDYDGDAADEGVAGELETLSEALYAEIQTYSEGLGTKAVYNGHRYPYWFDEAGERFAAFDAALLKAAYNYQYYQKDPGAFVHNGKFVAQILIDSIADLGGNVSAYTRP
jgi:hypothetical protein